ncbi:hypothetical protein GH714_035053 [Hevea brasiliensis]|uniref:Fatty acid desaturase N-terminal domain-containing protein n=1 Tax=Hevea brasiliensis TaxID=3981 RepID=A0A6A6MJ53_HEVBR|nr:hypothetical protein GH714_035053 [Hevea brasiliensis]
MNNNHNFDAVDAGRDFDPSNPPPFKISEIRAAIPKHCWVKNPGVCIELFSTSIPWICSGHGSFSDSPLLNNVSGHLLHSSILVPYTDGESATGLTIRTMEMWRRMNLGNLDFSTRIMRYTVPLPMFAYPIYLWTRSPGKEGSHFNPYSDLFAPHERGAVLTSTICWTAMVLLLLYSCSVFGSVLVLKLYGVPYMIFIMWLDFVTYLHHHGYEQKLPWYRSKTKAAKPVLGKYYREPKKSGPFPFHLFRNLVASIREDHYVSDIGDIVYYQTDTQLYKLSKSKLN